MCGFRSSNERGISLISVLVAVGILGVVTLTVARMTADAGKLVARYESAQDSYFVYEQIRQVLSEKRNCTVSLAGEDPAARPITFNRGSINSIDAGEGINFEIWTARSDNGLRDSRILWPRKKDGKIKISTIKFLANSDPVTAANYPNGPGSDIGSIVVTGSNWNGSRDSYKQWKFPIKFDISTVAGLSTILSCTLTVNPEDDSCRPGSKIFKTEGRYTLELPPSCTEFYVTAVGGGGGGGGGSEAAGRCGGGGGGSGDCQQYREITAPPGTMMDITVGHGGQGSRISSTARGLGRPGQSGGNTIVSGGSFSLTVEGGRGGEFGNTMRGRGGLAGGVIGQKGNDGIGCVYDGISAFTPAACNSEEDGFGGSGANSCLGSGGFGGTNIYTNSKGNNSPSPGAGGGGAGVDDRNYIESAWNGGDGGDGFVQIYWQ